MVWLRTPESEVALLSALTELDAKYIGFPDLFDYPPGEPLADARGLNDTAVESNGFRFVSLEWLRRLKQSAGRPKDLIDLEELEKVHGPPPTTEPDP